MKIAIDSYCYHRYFGEVYPNLEQPPAYRMTLDDFIGRARAHEVQGVSIESFMLDDSSPANLERLRGLLDDAGLELVWAWGHPHGLGSGARAEELVDLQRHVDIANALGAGVMRICAGGRRTRPESWHEHKAQLLPLLQRAADYAAGQGVVLAMENHVDLLAAEALELLEAVDNPALGVCLDTANNLRMFEDPMQVIELLAPHAKATHIKDICAFRGSPREFSFWPSVPLGEGLIDIPRTLQLLRQHGFDGLLALEIDYLHPAYGSEEEAIAKSLAFMRATLAQQQAGAIA
ncbi:xylose isomerase [Ectopseudomonas composti]|uniref:Xylose isomerase n=1 Tax=Ectopseudomonas composti TaxID=658457 RepID=A0ABN0S9H7_9GAMM|nr:sugar phosphate isomerase/epimerase family protein [Pseudomonas composti]EZH78734.1 xylose isomerase [Pseudomonas composti]